MKRLYDTGLVDEVICGNYDGVVNEINNPLSKPLSDYLPYNIYERYVKYYAQWGEKNV